MKPRARRNMRPPQETVAAQTESHGSKIIDMEGRAVFIEGLDVSLHPIAGNLDPAERRALADIYARWTVQLRASADRMDKNEAAMLRHRLRRLEMKGGHLERGHD